VARGSRVDRDNGDERGRKRHRAARHVGVRRLLGWAALLPLASRAPVYGRLFWDLVRDDRTPMARKAALAAAAGYLVVGRDLVPDYVPIIGGIDDLIVVVLALDVFLDGVPDAVIDERLDALGMDRRAFNEDVARIRRFTPAPVRRLVRRIPGAVAFTGDMVHRSRLGPKVRGWVNREGSIA